MTDPPDMPGWICQTCRKALQLGFNSAGTRLMHQPQDPDDHPVVPIRPPADWSEGQCDFCGTSPPLFVLPARAFDAPIQIEGADTQTYDDSGWAACEPCAKLLRHNRWKGLLHRHISIFQRRYGEPFDPMAAFVLDALWAELRKNITGPLRPIRKEGS